MSEYVALQWLARSALGGGLVLLVAWWGMRRVESPARRQRLGECGLVAALLLAVLSLAPAWLVPLPTFPAEPARGEATAAAPAPAAAEPPPVQQEAEAWLDFLDSDLPEMPVLEAVEAEPAHAPVPAPVPAWRPDGAWLARLVVVGYALAAGAMLAWWLLGHVVLWWWLRKTVRPSPRLEKLWREMTAGRRIRLVISPRVRVPFSCGLFRPAVVLPGGLAGSADEAALRWVLGHELAHLERRDPYSAVLFGIGQGLYFFLPWFWKLRHEVRLCQEYLADQAAVAAGGSRLDYADFLVGWARMPGLPAGVPAVTGQSTDLFRRIAMLLRERGPCLEPRCPRGWLLLSLSGLLGLAVLLAGVGPGRGTVSADDQKKGPAQDTKKEEKKPAPPATKDRDDRKAPAREEKKDGKTPEKDRTGFPDIEELMKRIPAGLDERQMKMIRAQLEAARRQMDQALEMARRMRPMNPFGRGRTTPHEGRLGVRVLPPSPTLAEQLDLPRGQGVVVEQVQPGSPAAKAGIKANDILLELAGKPVPSQPEQMARLVMGLEADKKVDAVVMRKGKKETIKDLTLPEVKPAREIGRLPFRFNGFPAAGGTMLNLQRSGDRFTVLQREAGRTISIQGKLVDGKAQVSEVRVIEGRGAGEVYKSVDKVPEAMREQVKSLVELAEKGVGKSKPKK